MKGRIDRRGFLLLVAGAAGSVVLAAAGLAGRVAGKLAIPLKRFDRVSPYCIFSASIP